MKDYMTFLESKRERVNPVGFDVPPSEINRLLFDWQGAIVRWALQRKDGCEKHSFNGEALLLLPGWGMSAKNNIARIV